MVGIVRDSEWLVPGSVRTEGPRQSGKSISLGSLVTLWCYRDHLEVDAIVAAAKE